MHRLQYLCCKLQFSSDDGDIDDEGILFISIIIIQAYVPQNIVGLPLVHMIPVRVLATPHLSYRKKREMSADVTRRRIDILGHGLFY